jgi:hypothetical protein
LDLSALWDCWRFRQFYTRTGEALALRRGLARMSADFLLSFLTSVQFVEVDQPLFTALELLKAESATFPVHSRVWCSAQTARLSSDLSLKKSWWLVLMALFEPMQEHVYSTARDPNAARAFVVWLPKEIDALFGGKYHAFDKPLAEFVATCIASYCAPQPSRDAASSAEVAR